jgi:ATP-dependent Clp protease adaptor protein ClpS
MQESMMSADDNNNDAQTGANDPGIAIADKTELEQPKMYKVLMHNDDYSTMEFVIHALMKFFNKNYDEAHAVMLNIHNDGIGLCGLYTYEVAESKSAKVNRYSKGKGHPLKTSIEPCD